ncbi:hypothetical protein THAOC_27476 [Thalassiosira oceanica]|uniref:Uncharacterized protein n=1 Tax=Thalassiosira oceanica TaxID=159749 RepID=K0RLK0_THAOC|nr:hypothetical protein THAOC_27476 [Thalassiosira oceanica]|eukprot:EJK53144.1 hypothetical protein THAOC_27476 [Thalassiosira oceanica]
MRSPTHPPSGPDRPETGRVPRHAPRELAEEEFDDAVGDVVGYLKARTGVQPQPPVELARLVDEQVVRPEAREPAEVRRGLPVPDPHDPEVDPGAVEAVPRRDEELGVLGRVELPQLGEDDHQPLPPRLPLRRAGSEPARPSSGRPAWSSR